MMKRSKGLAALLVLTLLLCLLPSAALAEAGREGLAAEIEEPGTGEETVLPPEEATETGEAAEAADAAPEEELPPEPVSVTVSEGETYYAEPGELVYNNAGTVFANAATVYNNGGLAYNNGGLLYNNAGTVYSNGGVVYNNGGRVYSNGAVVYAFDGDVETSLIAGYYRLSFDRDYGALIELEGLAQDPNGDEPLLAQGQELILRAKEGFRLTKVEADNAVAAQREDGSWTVSEPSGPVALRLTLKAEAPVLSLAAGTYAGEQTLEISAVEGGVILYTTDGSAPEEGKGTVYEGPIRLSESARVTAVVSVPEAEASDTVSAAYAIVELSAPQFAPEEAGYNVPEAQPIIVANPGTVAAVIESVTLSGGDVEAFTLSRSTGGRVSAGLTDNKTWTVRPVSKLETGDYSATVTLRFEGGASAELNLSFRVT